MRDIHMDLLKDMSKFGLQNINLTGEQQPVRQEEEIYNDQATTSLPIEDLLYRKKTTCPVCHKIFPYIALRSGKNRLLSTDDDLKAYYSIVDPIVYDVLHCDCGYTAMSKTFPALSFAQINLISESIVKNFKPIPYAEIRHEDDAIELYKLALVTTIVKKGRSIEKGLICLRLAWLYRDMKDAKNEMTYLDNAYKCFREAIDTEKFPIMDMTFDRTSYLVAILAYKCGHLDVAMQYASIIIADKQSNPRLRDRAIDLKAKLSKSTA